MSKLITNTIRHTGASSDSLTFNSDGHATVENNLTVDGTSTLTGNVTVAGSLTASNYAGRNLISNGEFLIAQRSTAAVTTSAGSNEGYQTVDRWRFYVVGTAAFTQQQVELTTDAAPDGFSRALKIDCTTADASVAAGDYVNLQQNIEGFTWAHLNYGRSDAKTVTISFWVKATKTGTYTFGLRNEAANRSYIAEYTVSSTNTWEKKTITIAGDTSGTWLTTNGIGARLGWSLIIGSTDSATAGSWNAGNKFGSTNQVNGMDNTDNNFLITGVQLEVGPATEFEHRLYADELLRCQRYFETSYNPGVTVGSSSNVGGYYECHSSDNGSNVVFSPTYRVTKRAVPTDKFWKDDGTANQWTYSRESGGAGAGVTSFRSSQTHLNGYVDCGASWVPCALHGHWSSEAEL